MNPSSNTSAQHSAQNTATGDASKMSGHMHATKGNMKEGLGNMTGSTRLQQSGQQERMAGETELNAAKGQGYAQGTADRMGGKKDEVVGAATGDRSQQARGNMRQDKGEAQQSMNRGM